MQLRRGVFQVLHELLQSSFTHHSLVAGQVGRRLEAQDLLGGLRLLLLQLGEDREELLVLCGQLLILLLERLQLLGEYRVVRLMLIVDVM